MSEGTETDYENNEFTFYFFFMMAQINKLQKEIDREAEQQALFYLKKEDKTSGKEQRRAAESFAKSEQRMQTLAMLMLHYCSGIQHCNEELSNQADEEEIKAQVKEQPKQQESEIPTTEKPVIKEPDQEQLTSETADPEEIPQTEGISGSNQDDVNCVVESSSEETDGDAIVIHLAEQSWSIQEENVQTKLIFKSSPEMSICLILYPWKSEKRYQDFRPIYLVSVTHVCHIMNSLPKWRRLVTERPQSLMKLYLKSGGDCDKASWKLLVMISVKDMGRKFMCNALT